MLTNPDGDLVMTNMMYWDHLNGSMDIESIGSIAHQISSYFKPDSFNVSSSIVRLLDGVDDSNDGCSAPINDNEINGNVALINRGTCAFGLKITHAQQAGATAVIVTNNIPDEGLLTMGGGDYSINIPSVFVSYEDGQSILTLLAEQELEVELSGTLKTIDSALDNGVIAHEWGHYITNRLVQDATGLSNNQGGSLGEGWGDFIALMLMIREEDRNVAGNEQFQGYYADAQYAAQDLINGTRRAPYSIDMSKNGLTFKHIEDGVELPANVPASYNNAEVHNAGEIWAVTLLEAYVALLNREELSFQQAQERMKDYLVAGLKMTPMAPTYTEARDAFLSAALANDPIDFELMFESFAKRGMGINAVSPLRYSEDHAGVVEDFSINGAAADFKSISLSMFDANTEYCDNDNVLDVGETMTLMFEIVNRSTTALENVQIVLSSEADVTFSNGGIVEFPVGTKYGEALKGTIQMTLNSASHFEELNLTWSFVENDNVTLPAYNYATTITANYDIAANQRNNDDLELAPATLADWSGYVSDSAAKAFVLDGGLNDERFGRGQMFFGHHNDTHQVTAIFSPEVTVGDTGEFSLEFFHAFQFYRGLSTNGDTLNWSGGRILVSIDGADSVELDSTGAILDVGYNGEIDAFTLGDSEEHPKGFVESNGNGNMEKIVFPEGVLNGKTVKFVFVLLTGDTGVSEGGWWLDDFKFENTKTPAFSGISLEDGECVSRSNIGPSLDLIDYIAVKEKDSNGNRTIVTLEPTAFDPDGDELFYHWEQESGTTGLLSTTDTLSTTFTVPEVSFHEELILTLRVTDKHFSATKSVRIDVRNVNLAPEVSILADGSVQEKKEMTLLAQLTERDGDEVTYQWTQVSGPIVSTGSKTASSITFTAPEVEEDTTLVFQLVADDGLLESSIASKTITITNKKSSGGSMNWFILLLLGLTFHRRKFRK
jgi:large repetitive protein